MSARILVVEDETITARRIQATLKGLGYVVTQTVSSGIDALAAVAAQAPDLVLMDIQLPGKFDGIDVAERIRERHAIPVVYLTSSSDETTISRAKRTGAYGYVLKPFDDRDLKTAVEIAIHKRELEERSAERERWFRIALKSIGDGVVATDADQRITFMNAVAERVTGWTSNEGLGRPLGDVLQLFDESSGARVEAPIARALGERVPVELARNVALRTKAGARRAADGSAAPIVDEKGDVIGYVVVLRDVTERRELEQRLARVERLAALGTLSAGIAHEINNPLAYVLANVDLALERLPEAAAGVRASGGPQAERVASRLGDLEDALREAKEGGQRVHRIIQGLTRFGRTDPTQRATVELTDMIEAAIRMTANLVRHHGRVRRDFQPTPRVEGNEGQLEQVFVNLLVNAAQAIGEGLADTKEIVVVTYTDALGRAVAEVRDSGPGIAPEHLHRVFDPFFTTKAIGKGSGLGLSISHGIVQSHGGEITVSSEPGKGTAFRVSLPPARARSSTRPPVEKAPSPSRRGRVLVIDDEPAIGRVMSRILSRDHDVFVVTDPRGALEALSTGQSFDVVFCDLMMPGMTGMDFVDAIRTAKPELLDRIVLLTGGAFTPRADEFLRTTKNVTLMKPIDPAAVRQIVLDRMGAPAA